MKIVGTESQKTYAEKLQNGFFDRFMSGNGLDIGYAGYQGNSETILKTAVGIDLNTPNYDGKTLPFPNNSQSYVYSSHCLEHIADFKQAIQEWFRVTKKNGNIICIVPHKWLYEKKESPPSRFNGDHKRFYYTSDLIREFEESLPINSFRVRHCQDNDKGHDYSAPNTVHANWLYEIELVIEKIID